MSSTCPDKDQLRFNHFSTSKTRDLVTGLIETLIMNIPLFLITTTEHIFVWWALLSFLYLNKWVILFVWKDYADKFDEYFLTISFLTQQRSRVVFLLPSALFGQKCVVNRHSVISSTWWFKTRHFQHFWRPYLGYKRLSWKRDTYEDAPWLSLQRL